MIAKRVGRPREFERDVALKKAARLFWEHGFSGTSTRVLAAELGISSSSLYAAFGTKGDLFDEAVRTYALRYSAIYDKAVRESTIQQVIERLFVDSIAEFSRGDEGHPGCLTSSAVMADTSATLNVRAYVVDLQRSDETRLSARMDQAVRDGDLGATVNPAALAEFVQTVWQGLSARSELGASKDELTAVARLALALIAQTSRSESATSLVSSAPPR